MVRVIVIAVVLAAVGGGIYFVVKNKGNVKDAVEEVKKDAQDARKGAGHIVDEARGYPDAKTPKEAADLFTKAIKERKYKTAAKYCTAKYGELLTDGDAAGNKLGEAIDNLSGQMTLRNVMNDEMKTVLYVFDPFNKAITITVGNESEKEALATLVPNLPTLTGQSNPFTNWKIDPSFWGAFTGGPLVVPLKVKLVKEGDVWKFDFPNTVAVQVGVARLKDRHNVYVQKMETISKEIKNDADTKENVLRRMKELFEDAAK